MKVTPLDEFCYYNNWDFNALGTIFKLRPRKSVFEALKTEIAVAVSRYPLPRGNGVRNTGYLRPSAVKYLSAQPSQVLNFS